MASGGTATTEYQTPGGLAIGTVTVTATDESGVSGSQTIVIPTCQPSGGASYPSSGGGPYPSIAPGGSIPFTVSVVDCPGVTTTVAATAADAGGGTLVLLPSDGVVVSEGSVLVTFQSQLATTATITITATDSLGSTNTLVVQKVVVQ